MFRKIFLLLTTLLCLTSCATIVARKEYTVKLYSKIPDAKARVKDSIYNLPASIIVERSRENLAVSLIDGSVVKDIEIKSELNPYFIYGNLPFGLAGYLIDFTNDKRFYYGRKILLDEISKDNYNTQVREKTAYFKRNFPTHKRQLNIIAAIPYANGFYLQPHNEPAKPYFGFFGITIGAEYFYKDNKFIKFTAGRSIDFEAPVPVSVDYDGSHESANATNFTLTDNYKLGRFTLGYGLNYAIYTWKIINSDYNFPDNDAAPRTKNSHSYGLSFSGYHQFSKTVFLGVVYNPTFINSYPVSQFKYQHVISLDLLFKFTLHK